MRSILARIWRNKETRFFHTIVFALLFTILGSLIPNTYLQYFDKTEYIKYLGPVTFDKTTYKACENQQALTRIQILLSGNIQVKSRLYLTVAEKDNKYDVVKDYSFDTFLKSEPDPQILISTTQLPCELSPGVYFYRGVLTYKIKNVEKTTSFYSDQFTIDK